MAGARGAGGQVEQCGEAVPMDFAAELRAIVEDYGESLKWETRQIMLGAANEIAALKNRVEYLEDELG